MLNKMEKMSKGEKNKDLDLTITIDFINLIENEKR